MPKTLPRPAPGPDAPATTTAANPPGCLLLADGLTALPLHGLKVWQGRPWELAAMLLGSMSLVWIATPSP